MGLLRLAWRYGLSSPGDYVDNCHMCYEARRFPRPYYPLYLAPAHPYMGDDA